MKNTAIRSSLGFGLILLVLLTLLGAPSPARAAEISLGKSWSVFHARGKTYHNARLTKIEPDGLRISHDAGAAKIPREYLPTHLLTEFPFDSTAATTFRQEQQQLREEEEANVQRIKTILREQDIKAASQLDSQPSEPRLSYSYSYPPSYSYSYSPSYYYNASGETRRLTDNIFERYRSRNYNRCSYSYPCRSVFYYSSYRPQRQYHFGSAQLQLGAFTRPRR